MHLLAIDCATNACSAALWLDGGPGPHACRVMRRGHAEALMPMVVDVMDQAGLGFDALHAVAVTVGPGAFTGIRIGLSAARGFALAAGIPVVGVTTLEAVAAAQDNNDLPLLVALDSKREDVYCQLFGPDGTALTAPESRLPGAIAGMLPANHPVALAGDAARPVLEALAGRLPAPVRLGGPDLPDAAWVARIAAGRFTELPKDTPPPAPLYLRPPDATPARPGGR